MSRDGVVEQQTLEFLHRIPNFHRLGSAQQAETAQAMAQVVRAMADGAQRGGSVDPYSPRAVGLDTRPGGVQTVNGGAKDLLKKAGSGQVGGVIGAGVTQAARMVKEIDFPKFVASLIDGTFKAIVTTSIEQMKAYAEMVKSVSASLNEFKDRNTSDSEARASLAARYPQLMQITINGGVERLAPKDDAFGDDLPDFQRDLGLSEEVTSLDEDVLEQKLIPAMRDELARGRQQLLATTILMGINRIIVTDGKINARIRFKFDAVETTRTKGTARDLAKMGDTVAEQSTVEESGASSRTGWWSRSTGEDYHFSSDQQRVVTPNIQVTSEVETNTDGTIKAGGEMFGEVSINFRSESFPLEKMVNTDQMTRLEDARGFRGTPGPGAKAAAPTAAPTPAPAR
ncbi:MAG: hypothetical protein KF773_30715 [Deltaproteobacteria bacterium]|nr:hypothetical protein [Deltaproteobacteria bacterium]MCW5807147.1 hypothetical protein [Deltaproteobacteria bacterium]